MMLKEKAKIFATAAHAAVGQTRKYTGEPYIVHPIEVVKIVMQYPHTEAMICAAYLHDVLEDTQVTLLMLRKEFGDEVANLVLWLTKIDGPENRAYRKQQDREYLAQAPWDAQTVKVADLIANTDSIVEHDPAFAVLFLKEKKLLLDVLTKADKDLLARAYRIVGE